MQRQQTRGATRAVALRAMMLDAAQWRPEFV
jgi:hypothetical protein